MDKVKMQRQWLKSNFFDDDETESDQQLNLPQPPLQKPFEEDSERIPLPEINEEIFQKSSILEIIRERQSKRVYSSGELTLEELSFLLWSTQGVKAIKGNNYATIRTVPSAGARHPFETYLAVNRVKGLKSGVYRYLALSHELILLFEDNNLEEQLSELTLGQKFVGKSAVTFLWSVVPYRGEWRYRQTAHKAMILDAGHVCQNLYIACGVIGCGTCAIAAYDQKKTDDFLSLDGEDEFVIYIAPVGKV